jgi:ABC-type phosphate transport system substrate-binding protein
MKLLRQVAVAALSTLLWHGPAVANDITGAGSTFVSPLLSKWSAAYRGEIEFVVGVRVGGAIWIGDLGDAVCGVVVVGDRSPLGIGESPDAAV